jgi:polysaccharide biosynthesis transport protein
MELRTYFEILWRRKWLVLVTLLLTVSATAVLTYLTPSAYLSATTLRVATIGGGVEGSRTDIGYTERLMNTYVRIVTGASVRNQIKEALQLPERPSITVESIPNTELMKLNAEASTPVIAQQVAAAAAEILIKQSRELYTGTGQTTEEILRRQIDQAEAELATSRSEYDKLAAAATPDTARLDTAGQTIELKERTYTTLLDQYERVRLRDALLANTVSVVEPASLPEGPSTPRRDLNLALALIAGIIGGMGLALLFDTLDTTLYTVRQIETATRLPPIGRIPATAGLATLMDTPATPATLVAQEAFRRLRVNLLASTTAATGQAIMVTSATPGEGKSTVVANLAIAMARSGRRVVVVDCDLYLPTQHKFFKLANECGLTTVLLKQATVVGALQESAFPNLAVITSGPPLPTSTAIASLRQLAPKAHVQQLEQGAELLGLVGMKCAIEELKEQFDVVLLDTPALLSVADAAVVAPLVDQVLLVVACTQTQRSDLRAVNEQLETVKLDAIRLVVNRTQDLRSYKTYAKARWNGRKMR